MQTYILTGVVADGSARNSRTPRDTATTILVPQNGPSMVFLDVITSAGVPVDVSTGSGWTGRLSVQQTLNPCQVLSDLAVDGVPVNGVPNRNRLSFTISEADTRGWSLGRRFFDVWLFNDSTGARWQVVQPSAFILTAGLLRV